jgi:phosphatidylserine decarboxylase
MNRIPDVSPDLPPLTWRLLLTLLGKLPERGLSRSFGRIADIPLPPRFRRLVLMSFADSVGIDLSEVELPLEEYPSLNAFFVRRLRNGAREWPRDDRTIASPVDGVVGRSGEVERGMAIQAKGHSYPVADLLADRGEAAAFEGGSFLTIYLSPRHYHRIHTPTAGMVRRATYLQGSLYPVNAAAVMHIPALFARNERLVAHLETARGRVAVVAVGAYNVGRISAAFDPTWGGSGREPWVSNRRTPAPMERRYDPPHRLEVGDELMAFHLGSTVVLLFEPGVTLSQELRAGAEVRVGQPITD